MGEQILSCCSFRYKNNDKPVGSMAYRNAGESAAVEKEILKQIKYILH